MTKRALSRWHRGRVLRDHRSAIASAWHGRVREAEEDYLAFASVSNAAPLPHAITRGVERCGENDLVSRRQREISPDGLDLSGLGSVRQFSSDTGGGEADVLACIGKIITARTEVFVSW